MKYSISYSVLMLLLLLAAWPVSGEGEKEKVVSKLEQYEENLKKDVLAEKELRDKMIGMVNEMVTVVRDFDASAQSMTGISGLGRVEQLQFKAERNSAERQIRKRLEKDIITLADVVQQWRDMQDRVKEWSRQKKKKKRLVAMKSEVQKESKQNKENYDMESMVYYTVKTPGTLKQISALQEVYGNESAWRYLYDANRDKVSHPNAIVAAGVTLIVPSIKNDRKFINLD